MLSTHHLLHHQFCTLGIVPLDRMVLLLPSLDLHLMVHGHLQEVSIVKSVLLIHTATRVLLLVLLVPLALPPLSLLL